MLHLLLLNHHAAASLTPAFDLTRRLPSGRTYHIIKPLVAPSSRSQISSTASTQTPPTPPITYPAILFLHGAGGDASAFSFETNMTQLAPRYEPG